MSIRLIVAEKRGELQEEILRHESTEEKERKMTGGQGMPYPQETRWDAP
jgi:hypothetical protein